MRAKKTDHGMVGTRTYYAWRAMKQRCHNPNHERYKEYGARGIQVCEKWRFDFMAFMADMGEAPSSKHTIDRQDGTRGYEPGNCRWATMKEQAENTRLRSTSVFLTFQGETLTVTQWADKLNIPRHTIYGRIKGGWKTEDILTLSPHSGVSSGGWRKVR